MENKKNYSSPELKKIGTIEQITMGPGMNGEADGKSGTYKPIS